MQKYRILTCMKTRYSGAFFIVYAAAGIQYQEKNLILPISLISYMLVSVFDLPWFGTVDHRFKDVTTSVSALSRR